MLNKYEVIFKWYQTKIIAVITEPMGNLHPDALKLYFINRGLQQIENEWQLDIRDKINFDRVEINLIK